MGSIPNFNYDKTTVPFKRLRGGVDIDPPTLVNYDETIGVMDREHLGGFITGLGLIEREGPFPESFGDISDDAVKVDDKWLFEAYELVDGALYGLRSDHLMQAIRLCGGTGGFDPSNFALYIPTGTDGGAPFLVASSFTPEEFIFHRLFGSKEGFLEKFGANACPECETVADDPFIDCPNCATRADSVDHNVELIQEEHDGVIVALAPVISSDGMEKAVDGGRLAVRRPTEHPDPEFEVIESPGA